MDPNRHIMVDNMDMVAKVHKDGHCPLDKVDMVDTVIFVDIDKVEVNPV